MEDHYRKFLAYFSAAISQIRAHFRYAVLIFLTVGLLLAAGLVGAEREVELYVFPNIVSGEGWENPDAALAQDYSPDATFSDTSREFSAWVAVGELQTPEHASTTESVDASGGIDGGSGVTVSQESEGAELAPTEEGPSTDTVSEASEESVPSVDVPAPSVPASDVPLPEPSPSSPDASAEGLLDTIFSSMQIPMRAFAQDLMPAAEIETPTGEVIEDERSVPELPLSVSSETSTDPVSESMTEESAIDAVLESIREEERSPASARSVALCATVGTACRLLEFSHFGIGGAFPGKTFSGASLQVSIASLGGTENGISDSVIVRAYHSGVWSLIGEELLSEERSNASRGGYLTFPLDMIEAWEDLDDLVLVVEYMNASGAAAEVRVDSAWIALRYRADDLADDPTEVKANVIRTLAVKDAAMRAERRDTLALPDHAPVRFVHDSAYPDAALLVKSDRNIYRALGSMETYFNVTNLSDEPEEFHLEFHAPTSSAQVRSLARWTRNVPITIGTMETKPVGYFCEAGWAATTSDATRYSCAAPEEVRTCDALNQDGTNCVAGGAQTDVSLETVTRDAWRVLPTANGSFRDDDGLFARAIEAISAQLPEDAIPTAATARAHAPETILLAPGQTAYFRAEIEVPLNARGEFFIEAAARSGAYGLVDLAWEGSWNWRVPIAIDQSALEGGMMFTVPIDLSGAPDAFWSRVKTDGADIRFADHRGMRELPFALSDWNYDARLGRAWVAVGDAEQGTSTTVMLYYGDSEADTIADPVRPFRSTEPTPRYRLLGNAQTDVTVQLLSLADGVTAGFQGGITRTLSRGESMVGNVSSGSVVVSDGPIEATAYAPEGSARMIPLALAGEQFMSVDTSISHALLPEFALEERTVHFATLMEHAREVADVEGDGEAIDVIPESTVSVPSPSGRSGRYVADGSVLASLGIGAARIPLAPVRSEPLVGLALGRSVVGAFTDATAFTVLCERGSRTTIDGRRAGVVTQNDTCSIGSGTNAEAFTIAPVGGSIVHAFMDPVRVPEAAARSEWSSRYVLPEATDRIIVLCDGDRDTEVGVFAPSHGLIASTTCAARGAYPAHATLDAPLGSVFPAASDVRSYGTPASTFGLLRGSDGADAVRSYVRLFGVVTSRGATPSGSMVRFSEEEFVIPGEHRLLDRTDEGVMIEHANDLVIAKREFSAREKPTFAFTYRDREQGPIDGIREAFGARPFRVESIRVVHNNLGEVPVVSDITYGDGFDWSVSFTEEGGRLRPGKYHLEITIDDSGETVTDSFDFFWGVLAINTHRSVYVPGDTMQFSMGALSDNGNTICDAKLKLWIRDPIGEEVEVPVTPSGACNGNNIVDVPDYAAQYVANGTGNYQVKLVRFDADDNVAAQSEETIEVRESVPFVIERSGPTRIYPLAHYPMTLSIRALRDFTGRIVERIPGEFVVIDRGNADLEREGDAITASWDMALKEGETRVFQYTFDAPDRSPYLFEVGPLSLVADDGPGFVEARQWQIASDAAGKMMVYWDRSYTPTGWICVSCAGGDPFFQRFAMGSSTYGTTGGTATHTPTAAATVYVTASTGVGPNSTNNTNDAPNNHTHTLTPQIGGVSNNPAFRELKVLQSTSAGDPTSIPGGAIAMFDVASSSLPSGWYRYAPLDGRFPLGENGAVSTGGAATHAHTATGTLSASVGSGFRAQTNVASAASVTHTHTLSATTTGTVNHEPPYIETLYAQLPATSTPSNYMIGMWDNTPPDGWVTLSDVGGAFEGKFLKASTTYGATGGTSNHAHGDLLNATTSAPSAANNYNVNAANAQAVGTHTHLVDITGFSTDTHLPRYVEVIFAKRLTGIVLYAQNTYRFYANTNAITPTDPWPSGASDLDENTAIGSAAIATKPGSVVRVRMSLGVSNSTSTPGVDAFKLQYAETADCVTTLNWSDVSSIGSTTALWRGFNNTSVTDGANLPSVLLSTASTSESYTEANPSTTTPSQIDIGKEGEWDWVIEQNLANAGVNYCFRMVESDGTPLDTYTNYPQILTNAAPGTTELGVLFDNEKVGTTSPSFTFSATDPEGNDIDYEIQIDTSSIFASPDVDRDSTVNPELFDNVSNPVNKAPFNSGDTITTKVTGLTDNTTYWWRVRAKDTTGSNTWGGWSTARSFTTDTSVTVSTWHQTTDAQFNNGNTLVGVEATTTDSVTLITGSTTGAFYGSMIDFAVGTVGTVWGSLAFSDLETVGDIKYHLEYLSATDTWAMIPDADLAGNIAGFDVSPVSLLSIDPNTYDRIRIRGDFTDVGGSPRLHDWTIAWGFTVNTPTLYVPFDNAIVSTTTPVFEFLATDPQSDSVTYQISWSTSNTFTSSTTRESNIHSGFQNLATPADLDPFNSGDRIRFTVQPADLLTGSTTYFWRVRARDPLGGNTYSFWSNIWSTTVSTSTTVATWYQTVDGQFSTDALTSFETYGANTLRVATNTGEVMIAYGEGTVQTPRYRLWNGTALGGELSALTIGATVQWVVLRASSIIGEYMLGTLGSDRDVNLQVYRNGAWGDQMEITTSAPSLTTRSFDMAYETLSGRAMVVACDGDADPSYRLWDGSAWAATGTIDVTGSNNCEWIRLASDPVSDEIILVERDSGTRYEAQVWNGSSWGSTTTLGSMVEFTHEGMAVAYEESGNQAVVAVSNGANANFTWTAWNGTSWSAPATQGLGDDFEWGNLRSDRGSDVMTLCYVDHDNDVGAVRWTGAAWVAFVELDTAGSTKDGRPVDCVYENTAGRDAFSLAAYGDGTNARYRYWTGAAWQAEASISTIASAFTSQLARALDDRILGVFFETATLNLEFSDWDGAAWTATQTIEGSPSVTTSPYGEPFMLAPKNPPTRATIVSTSVDFDDGVSPAWKRVSWSSTQSGSSTLAIQIEYLNASGTWALIPDSDIPNNSVGTTTGPISISSLDTTTYNQIRLRGSGICVLGVCPYLHDWRIEWAEGIRISGTAKAHDLTTNVTSGTVAVAVNGNLQIGKTGSISNGEWFIDNVTVFQNQTVTIFVDSAANTNEAVAIGKYTTAGDFGGFALAERWITIGSASTTGVSHTLTDLGYYDNSTSGDEDLFFDVSAGGDLTSCADTGCGDASVRVLAANTFRPNASVGKTLNTFDMRVEGTLASDANTFKLGGNWRNLGTLLAHTSTFVFNATTSTRTIDSTGAASAIFYNVTFGESGSTAQWDLSSPLTATGTTAISFGTLSPGAHALTLEGDLTIGASGIFTKGSATTTFAGAVSKSWTDSTASKQDLGKVLIDGTTKTLTMGSNVKATDVTIGANDTLDASLSNRTITVLGRYTNLGTFTARQGTVDFAALSPGNPIEQGASNFYNLTFSGSGGTWNFTTANATATNDVAITAGTLTLPSGTFAVGGSFDNTTGDFAPGTGVLKFTGSAGGKNLRTSGVALNELLFAGSGVWTFLDTNATTTATTTLQSGTVTLPSGTFAVGTSFQNTGATVNANSGTLKMTASDGSRPIRFGGSSLANILVAGAGAFTIPDTNATTTADIRINAGSLAFPSGVLAIGGSFVNATTFSAGTSLAKFTASSGSRTVDPGSSSFTNVEVRTTGGSLTFATHATTTGTFTIASANTLTFTNGITLAVGSTFTNQVGGASTTWAGATLALNSGTSFAINTKTSGGDAYGTLKLSPNTHIRMWNSSATTYAVDPTASLYSQDHNAVDGDLYLFGAYARTSGTDWWSYATDFDGTTLSGASRRGVNVRLADTASVTFTGGTLEMLGDAAASTTVDRQAAGVYGISLANATISAQFYQFRNMNIFGLNLSASTTVSSLRDGDFEVSTVGGSAITVASTTIDQNPGLQIFAVRFATSSAIAAANVTEIGVPTSFWRFREHYGNLAGEAFDVDPGGNPGYVRWDDSNFIISISGFVYSDAGVNPMGGPTCDNLTPSVRVKVDGAGNFAAPCDPLDGSFTVPGVTFQGDTVMTIYLDTNTGPRAVTVTRSVVADLAGVRLYQDRVILRHEDVNPISIADLNAYDSVQDSDIPFLVTLGSPNTLVIEPEKELWIWDGMTFVPDGNITINSGGSGNNHDGSFHIDNNAVFTAAGTESHSVGGKWTADSGATFTAASSTFTFTATTTGKAITALAPVTFWNVVLNGAGGNWSANTNITIGNDLTVTAGTLSGASDVLVLGANATGAGSVAMTGGTFRIPNTASIGGSGDWSFFSLTLGTSTGATTTKSGSGSMTIARILSVVTASELRAGSSLWDLTGSSTPFSLSGIFTAQSSVFRYSATGTTTITPATYAQLVLAPFAGGAPTYTLAAGAFTVMASTTIGDGVNAVTVTANTNDPTFSANGNFTVQPNATFIGSNSALFAIARDWVNQGTFTHSSGTTTFSATTTGRLITPGSSAFGNVDFASATGGWTITGHATSSANFFLATGTAFTLATAATLEVRGKFENHVGGAATTWTGSRLYLNSGGAIDVNTKSVGADQYAELEVGASTHARIWNSDAATTTVAATGSLYSQDHNAVDGDLVIRGAYVQNIRTDHWSYARDFDGASLAGSERTVQVRIASGTSVTISGAGALEAVGGVGATTTIDRLSAGAYAFNISGGSTTMSFTSIRHTNGSGLNISGTPVVESLSDVDFELAETGGSMITVAGATIDANPLKIFFRNRFATSTGVSSGFNVKATGVSASAWRFNLHDGNLSGEAFDSDPGGDPGYIIWDDSAANIIISGNVYSDEGVTPIGGPTCNGVAQNVRLRVQGAGNYTSACDGTTGAFSISNVIFNPGDTLTLYLDIPSGARAANISLEPATNIPNMHLYQDRVILRHEGAAPMTIAAINVYDSDQDPEIPLRATSGSPNTLVLPASTGLIIWNGKTFTPGGNVTVHANASVISYDGTVKLLPSAIWSAAATEVHTIGGSFLAGASASVVPSTSSFVFTATTSGKFLAASSTLTFNDLSFSGASGGWDASGLGTTTDDLFITAGAVTFPTTTVAIGGSLDNSGGTFNANGGSLRFTSTAAGKVVRASGSSLPELVFTGAGGAWSFLDANATSTATTTIQRGTVSLPGGTFALAGSFENATGTIIAGGGTLKLTATSGEQTIRFGGSSLANILIAGAASVTIPDTHATTTGDLLIASGTLRFASTSMAIGGSLVNASTFFSGSSTVAFTATTSARTVDPGSSSFTNVEVRTTGGSLTFATHATTTGTFTIASANTLTFTNGITLAVGSTFTNQVGGASTTWTGATLALNSGTSFAINTKTSGGDAYGTLKLSPNTHIRMWNSSATTYAVDPTASLYSQDHNAVDGDLYLFGAYARTSGTDWWSYATDFDGTTLSGASRRGVNVRLADTASVTFTGGTLEMLGDAAASTTVDRISAGSYGIALTDTTLNATNYRFRNLNTSGLQLLGATVLTSLDNGDFELAANGGALISIASTTIDQNANALISLVRFATSSAISGADVRRIGTSSTAINFRFHYGNLAGEFFDDDGIDQCGQVRWDDSQCLFVDEAHYRWRNDDGGEGAPQSEWYDANWAKRKRVRVVNNSASTVANAQVEIAVTYDADMQSDFDDLRFTDSSGTTSIPFWIESYTASASSTVWVKVPSLPASSYADVFMYYGNGSAGAGGSGTTTFKFFDDFEDADISDYSGDTSFFTTNTSFNYERTRGLSASSGNEPNQTTDGIGQTGLGIGQGTTFRFYQYIDMTSGGSNEPCVLFATQAPFTGNQNYAVCLEPFGQDKIVIAKDISSNSRSGTSMVQKNVTYTTGWYKVIVDWMSGGTIGVSVYDTATGNLFATTSTTTTAYTTGGIGFSFWGQHGGWDAYTASQYIPATPSVAFGLEQTNSGATWKAAEDVALINQLAGENIRLRFSVKNTGLTVNNQNYRLQVASKGASPNCEAVPNGSYNDVTTTTGGCGSSAACMTASSQFADRASTTQHLSFPSTMSFSEAQIMEDPSNQTSALTLLGGKVTEVEYNFQMTAFAVDAAYCLRTTNGGTALDNYSRVAEVRILHAPTISNFSLNDDRSIALTEGTTTRIYATGTVSDLNGYADIVAATGTYWRSGVSGANFCSANDNNCYQIASSSCSLEACAGNSCTLLCSAYLQFFADPTDIGTYASEQWDAKVDVWDTSDSHRTATSGEELYTLRAISMPSTINYGSVVVGFDTGATNASTSVTNTGNSLTNLLVSGTDMTSGASSIAAAEQKYATSTFTYSSCTLCSLLSTTTQPFALNLAKPTTTTPVFDRLYWGINIPLGTAATVHTGTSTFIAN